MSFFFFKKKKKGVKEYANASVGLYWNGTSAFQMETAPVRVVGEIKFRFWTRFGIFNVIADKYI